MLFPRRRALRLRPGGPWVRLFLAWLGLVQFGCPVDFSGGAKDAAVEADGDGGTLCGNGILEAGEACDGTDFGGVTCTDLGFIGGVLHCGDDCRVDTTECVPIGCGNGVVEEGEECDHGEGNSDTHPGACRTDCRLPGCGDGVIDPGEECDDATQPPPCSAFGLDGGPVGCSDCVADLSGCWECGDGSCDEAKGENAGNCPEDCGVILVSAGEVHTCALDRQHRAWCWGANGSGQLGDGTTDVRDTPEPVQTTGDVTSVVAISAGWSHSCLVDARGRVWCWGANNHGQLGLGNYGEIQVCPDTPIAVGERFLTVSAGGAHTCGITTSGKVFCWGYNYYHQLAQPDGVENATPLEVQSLGQVVSVACGRFHSCAVSLSGGVRCWGDNMYGQLGNGSTGGTYETPTIVAVNGIGQQVSTGQDHTCVGTAGGALWCWGPNSSGQLGDGTVSDRNSPVQVRDLSDARAVSAGWSHTCALDASGTVWCWGGNARGQLGTGNQEESLLPVLVQWDLPGG